MPQETGLSPVEGLLVFAQAGDARVDIFAWDLHAHRFFAMRVGLTEDRLDVEPLVRRVDTVRFVVAPAGFAAGIRTAHARPRDVADLALADAAEVRSGGSGLALLARRCETVWRVDREGDGDVLALRLAALLASVLLGPIVDLSTREMFGVKTARAKLEALQAATDSVQMTRS